MSASFVTQRNYNRAPLRHALDLALEDSQLRRIDQIVGGIYGEKRRADFFQTRARIVIVGSLESVKNIIRVARLEIIGDEFVERFIRFRERRRILLAQDWIAAHEPKH